jgi:peroxiredoxin/predicted 2-oxoglutarate/Fe(II)-dependent dioxygenase YbiX
MLAGGLAVLCFYESAGRPDSLRVLRDFADARQRFDGTRLHFAGVSVDPEDRAQQRVTGHAAGFHHYWDFDRAISRLYGAAGDDASAGYARHTLILDERLRVLAVLPFDDSPGTHAARVLDFLSRHVPGPGLDAPVLVVPRLFEPKLCQALIRYFDQHGGTESGVMVEVEGKTVHAAGPRFKRRRDQEILDNELQQACMARLHDRLVPEIRKAFQFQSTRIERYIVACYDAGTGGYFRPHRDDTTHGTAHRRFAVSLNLNTGEYEGGNLRFPEFGTKEYIPPLGGAVVFSCSLLHEATPVTRGRRYAFLPFLYDEEAARLREQNLAFVDNASTDARAYDAG